MTLSLPISGYPHYGSRPEHPSIIENNRTVQHTGK
jgi:hypothetical protein